MLRSKPFFPAPGDNRRFKGEDLMQGSAALKKGDRIAPAAMGLLAPVAMAQPKPIRIGMPTAMQAEVDELLTIVPLVKRLGGKLIAITGNEMSSLAQEADIHLDARVDQEACPLNLAPTASTTAALINSESWWAIFRRGRGMLPS